MNDNINIKYVNNTGLSDFEVMVFTKNFSTRTTKTYYVAWQILRGQTSIMFQYPVLLGVAATYEDRGLKIVSGPFDADLGSSWRIVQRKPTDTAILSKLSGLVDNPDGTIVVENKEPMAWNGRMFDVGIYKKGRLLITQKDVHCGDQIDFLLKPKLYFAVIRNCQVGDVFTSMEITTNMTEFDLSNYPNGLEVTLSEAAGGGQYSFLGESKIIT